MSRPSSPVALSAAPSAHRSPHRLKKSKTELPPPAVKPTTPRLAHSPPASASALTAAAAPPASESPFAAAPRPHDIDRLDEQLSAVTLRDSSILALCDALAREGDGAVSQRRLAFVRGIRDKLIGSESNKALCVHFKHHRALISLLAQSVDADEADEAELRLQLLTALSSLAVGGGDAQQQLLQDGLMDVLFECVRSGQQPLVDAAIVALRPLLLFSASSASAQHSSAIATAFSHVDLVLHLINCFRQWQTHTSDAAAAALTAMAKGSLTQQLCLLQHGLLHVLMSHLAAYKPSLPSQPVAAPFAASLRLLAALCHDNVYLVAYLSLPASQFSASLSQTSSTPANASLFPFAASLLLHPQPDIRLHAASLLVHCALAHVRLQRSKRSELQAEESLIRDSELLRLHREWTASPIGKRGRAGNAKGGHRRHPVPAVTGTFSLQQWTGALQPLLLSCTALSTSPFAAAVMVLSPLLARVLQVLGRLVDSEVNEWVVEAADALCEVLDGWDGGHDELCDQLLSLVLARLVGCSATSLAPSGLPDVRRALLRLVYMLCQQERHRRAVLDQSLHWSTIIDLCDSPSVSVQCVAMYVMGLLTLSCRAQHALALFNSPSKLRHFIALAVSRVGAVDGDDVRVSKAATYAISCLSRPHAFRPQVVETGGEELLAALIRWAKGPDEERERAGEAQGVSMLWRQSSFRRLRRVHALNAISNLVFRCDKSAQKRAIDGLGGWQQLLALLVPPVQAERQGAVDELFCGVLGVVKQLVGAALRHETDDQMYDWVDAKRQPEAKRDLTEPLLTTDDLSALLTTLAPFFSAASSGALLSSLLGVLVNVSSHPSGSAALLLSSSAYASAVLQGILQGLRSSQAEQRELAVLVLYNVLLLVVDNRPQKRDSSSMGSTELPMSRLTSGGRSRAAFGKRRRSVTRPADDTTSARRTRRRADGNGRNDSSASNGRRDSDGSDEADADATTASDEKDDEQPEVTYLVRLSTAGVIAELLRLDEIEADGAVLGRVRRVLVLLRMVAAVSTSRTNKQLLMQLRALEVDVDEEADSRPLDSDAAEEDDDQKARDMLDVGLREAEDDSKESDGGSVRVRWRSSMSGSRLGREEWMARHRAVARVRQSEERRSTSTEQQRQQQRNDDGDEKQYDSNSPGSADESSPDPGSRAENRLLRHYVREWITQPHAPRANDIDSVFGRLLASFDAPSAPSQSPSSSSASLSSSSSTGSSASSASPRRSPPPALRFSVENAYASVRAALDRRSRDMRAVASSMGVRLADQQRIAPAQEGSRRGEAHR